MISPIEGYGYYREMLRYISDRLRRPVYLIQRKTYYEVNELLRSGDVAAAFICSGSYILDAEPSGIEILAVPYAQGAPHYRAYVITGSSRPFKTLEDFRGASFAFTDPLSLTGRYCALYRLKKMGKTPGSFFSKTLYTGGHDASIRAVAGGQVDGATVDSLVYEYMRLHEAPEIARTKVLERSDPLGIPPFVVSPHLDVETRESLKKILLGMDKVPDGARILHNLGLDSFRLPPAGLYDGVRQVLRTVKQ